MHRNGQTSRLAVLFETQDSWNGKNGSPADFFVAKSLAKD